jgi:uncharacterized protein YfaS (alpha-2-macroglobulin family)
LLKRLLTLALFSLTLFGTIAQAASKSVEGNVYYKGGEPAKDAAVQLEDRITLEVVSRITDSDGHFRFVGLNPDRDYEIRAIKKSYNSSSHSISRFSSRSVEIIKLYLKQ